MSGEAYAETIAMICTIKSAATIQAALQLLNMISDKGQVTIGWDDFLLLCGANNRNYARRHLTRMKASGAIHFNTNDNIYISFLQWIDAPLEARQRAFLENDENDSALPGARHRASKRATAPVEARQRAFSSGGKSRVELSNDLLLTNEVNNSTQPPTDQNGETPDLDDLRPADRWCYDLLTDPEVGIMPENALRCAKLHTPAWLVKQVAAWWLKRDELPVNVLAWRLLNPGKSQAGPAGAAFLASDLYARHYPLDARQLARWHSFQRWADYADVIGGTPGDPRPDWPPGVAELVEKLPEPGRDPTARRYHVGGDDDE